MSNNSDFKFFFSQFVPNKKKLKIAFLESERRSWQQDVQSYQQPSEHLHPARLR